MKKVIQIEGMSCHHCEMHVEKSLLSLKNVKSAKASHIDKKCEVVLKKDVEDEVLIEKVKEAGYTVTSIEVL
jgi:copper chaperone CopZ